MAAVRPAPGTLDVAAGRETPFVVPWPPHGSLRIRIAVAPAERVRVSLGGAGGRLLDTYTGPAHGGEILAPAVPVGEWTLRVVDPDGPEQKVTIREGAGTRVELTR